MADHTAERQQVLYLWASGSALDSPVIGWAFHDGTDGAGRQLPDASPPYATGVDALRAGWMLLQSAQLVPPAPGDEHTNAYLEYEFVFTRVGSAAPND
ncbi:MAG: hypothetical protein AAGG08_18430 [Actinomycetota bacterium]